MSRDASASDRLRDAFTANGADILAYLERRVTVRADAADVLGETMIVAWRKVSQLPTDVERARMWLFVIARNSLANHLRGRRRAEQVAARFRAEIAESSAGDPAAVAGLALDVQRALATLPEEFAELVRLVHWDGFTLADSAKLLGIPAATARGRYLKARARLSDLLLEAPDPSDLRASRR